MGYIVRMLNNSGGCEQAATSIEYIQTLINDESLKFLMVKVDPLKLVTVPTAMSILNEIDS